MIVHNVKVCQYGIVHSRCASCGSDKATETIDCNQPDLHRPLETESKGWVQ